MGDESTPMEEGLRCPICFDFPAGEVFQCLNGHSICKQCSLKVPQSQCPECRVSYKKGYIRNRVAEGLLQTVEVDCPKVGDGLGPGCNQKVKLKDVVSHLKMCSIAPRVQRSKPRTPKRIQLCKLLGYFNCEFWIEWSAAENMAKDLPKVRDHFVQKHLGVDKSGPALKIKLMNFGLCKSTNELTITWYPVLLNIDGTPKGRTFLIFARIHPDDSKSLSWLNIFLGGGGHNHDHEGITSQTDLIVRVPGINWKFPAVGLASSNFESILKTRPFRTPLESLKHFINHPEDSLQVDLEVVMAKGKPRPPTQMNTKVQELFSMPVNLITNSSLRLASQSQPPKKLDPVASVPHPKPGPSSSMMAAPESRRPSSLPPLPLIALRVPVSRPPRGCASCRSHLKDSKLRYYCMQCEGDYLVCETCYKQGNVGMHKDHVFLLVDSNVKMGISYNGNAFVPEDEEMVSVMPLVRELAFNISRCQHTSHGDRAPFVSYICVQCFARPCCFCSGCMNSGKANEVHSDEHFLAVTDTKERAEFVQYLFYTGVLPKAVAVQGNPWL